MSQQIINIPINWDDDMLTKCVENGVVNEVKKKIEKTSLERLGLQRSYGYTEIFESIVKECVKELIEENKEDILKEVVSRVTRSITSSKAYKEAKENIMKE